MDVLGCHERDGVPEARWLLWQCVRVPLFLFLAVLEPVVSFVLGALALIGALTA